MPARAGRQESDGAGRARRRREQWWTFSRLEATPAGVSPQDAGRAVAAGLAFATTYLLAAVAQQALHRLRVRLFGHLQRLPVRFYDRTPIGDVISRCTADVETIETVFSTAVIGSITSLFQVVAATAGMVALCTPLAGVACVVLPPLALTTWYFQPNVRVIGQFRRPPARPLRQAALSIRLQPPSDLADQVRSVPRPDRLAGQLRVPLGQLARCKSFHCRQFRLDVHARRPFLRLSRAITAGTSGHTGPRRVAGAKAILRRTGRFLCGGTCGRFGGTVVAQDALGEDGRHLPAPRGRHVCVRAALAHRRHLPRHVEGVVHRVMYAVRQKTVRPLVLGCRTAHARLRPREVPFWRPPLAAARTPRKTGYGPREFPMSMRYHLRTFRARHQLSLTGGCCQQAGIWVERTANGNSTLLFANE